uniref:Secreted protein n=1 Tax=Panagrellus redivivus TaxID=6233 RepID=A0A7E4VCJ0_PANRE
MSFTKQLLVTLFGIAVFIAVSDGANTAGLIKKLLPKVNTIENLTTTVQNTALINVGVNCSYTEDNITVCGDALWTFLKPNLTSAQMTAGMAAASKYALTQGASTASAQLAALKVDVFTALKPVWTAIRKLAGKNKTYAAYLPKALKTLNKKATKKFLCQIGAKVKKNFTAQWASFKSAVGQYLPCLALCGL